MPEWPDAQHGPPHGRFAVACFMGALPRRTLLGTFWRGCPAGHMCLHVRLCSSTGIFCMGAPPVACSWALRLFAWVFCNLASMQGRRALRMGAACIVRVGDAPRCLGVLFDAWVVRL